MRRAGGLGEVARTGEAPIILWTPIYGRDECVGYRAKSIIGDPPCVLYGMVASMAGKRILALVEDHAPTQRTLPRPRTGEPPIILWTPIYGHDGCVGYRAKSIIGDSPVFFMVAYASRV